MKNILSYILPTILLIGIIILGYIRIIDKYNLWKNYLINCDIIIISLYIFWIIYEIKVSRNDIKQEEISSDYGTREFYGFSQALTIFSALWFNSIWHKAGIYHFIGFFVFIFGVIFRNWAIITLGKYYSHIVRKIDEHKIINTGPYKILRHPAYTGMIIAHVGVTVYFFNYITCSILIFLLIPSIIVRIFIEEKTLKTIEGYKEFSKKRKRIIPYIW